MALRNARISRVTVLSILHLLCGFSLWFKTSPGTEIHCSGAKYEHGKAKCRYFNVSPEYSCSMNCLCLFLYSVDAYGSTVSKLFMFFCPFFELGFSTLYIWMFVTAAFSLNLDCSYLPHCRVCASPGGLASTWHMFMRMTEYWSFASLLFI